MRPCQVAWTRPARSGLPKEVGEAKKLAPGGSILHAAGAEPPEVGHVGLHGVAAEEGGGAGPESGRLGSSMWMRSRAADTAEWASASAVATGALPHPGDELLDVADGRRPHGHPCGRWRRRRGPRDPAALAASTWIAPSSVNWLMKSRAGRGRREVPAYPGAPSPRISRSFRGSAGTSPRPPRRRFPAARWPADAA